MSRTLLGALLCALVGISLMAVPAAAAGTGDPVITRPVTGTTVTEYDGTVQVDFTEAPAGTYAVTTHTSAGPSTQQVTTDEATTVHSFQFERVYWATTVDVLVELTDDRSISDASRIHVTGYREPKLVSPAPNVTMAGWDGDVELDLTGAAPGYWNISVRDEDFTYYHTDQIYYSGSNPVRVIDFPKPRTEGQYRIDVSDSGGSHYWSTYYFDHALPVRVSSVSASRTELYSTVRDGFRDRTTAHFDLSRAARVVVRVRDSEDRVRFFRDLGTVKPGTRRFTWRGQADDDSRLPVGRYRMTFHARTAAGAVDEASLPLRIVSDTVAARRTVTWRGTQTDRRAKRGNCYFDGYSGSLRLDCWGGRYAEATYFFPMAAGARNVKWQVRGDVWCCDTGRIVRSGRLVAPRRYAVKVRITNWRAYEIHRVSLTYTYDRRR